MQKLSQTAIHGVIELKSGTRIGGSDDALQIGGTDLTCIKDPTTGRPYIPGSSLKGKMRSNLEKVLGKANREPCRCAAQDCPVCRVFGPHRNTDHNLGPTRIKVFDAPLIGADFKIELKTESVNRRDTGAAEHPRTLERVAPGARFRFRVDVMEFDLDSNFAYQHADGNQFRGRDALIAVVDHAIDLLISCGIGAGTSKGYGEIEIRDLRTEVLGRTRRIPLDAGTAQP